MIARSLPTVVVSLALVASAFGTGGCSSSGGDGTVSGGINETWQHGGGQGDQVVDVSRHFPSVLILDDGLCPDPEIESVCGDGDGCCPRNGVCCGDGTCASDLVSCTVLVLLASGSACPGSAPIECGAICCGFECCSDGTCDACGDVTSSNGQTSNPYDDGSGDDDDGGSSSTDPGSGEGTDPGSGTTNPDPDPEPTPSCSDGQVVCGDSCCDTDSRGKPRPHANGHAEDKASRQRATLTAPLFTSSSTAAK